MFLNQIKCTIVMFSFYINFFIVGITMIVIENENVIEIENVIENVNVNQLLVEEL